MMGFNNNGFDSLIIHDLLHNPHTFDHQRAYNQAQQILNAQRFGQGGSFNGIRVSDRIIPQIDLFKINHFDNAAKITSLKALQFAMRSESVEDLPFPVGTILTSEQMDTLISYNIHDIIETERFAYRNIKQIEMRKELLETGTLTGDVLNYSDVKIGTEYLIRKIGRLKCFVSGSKPRQTYRTHIDFKDIILPKISFRTEPFEQTLDWFKKQTIYFAKEVESPRLEIKLAGLDFHFGVGGVHASVATRKYVSTDTHIIKDIDVSGMYVAVAIANGFAPEHLGQDFVVAYKQLQSDRAQHKKGTTMNAVLKLAGNGVYGNSNNHYSCFFDSKYTFSVTVNGQLQICQLVEVLSLIPGLEIIQANTDGITCYLPRELEYLFNFWKSDWEKQTGLKLEEVEYEKMWIRDVNNYLALKKDGSIKRKGAYWYPIDDAPPPDGYDGNWNKDFSAMCVQKGIERVLIEGIPPEVAIKIITNPFDFMMRYKTPAGAIVTIDDKPMPKTLRYYASKAGGIGKKTAQPKGEIGQYKRKNKIADSFFNQVMTQIGKDVWDERIHTKNKNKYEETITSIEAGHKIKECNVAAKFNWNDVDFEYYIGQIKKLIV